MTAATMVTTATTVTTMTAVTTATVGSARAAGLSLGDTNSAELWNLDSGFWRERERVPLAGGGERVLFISPSSSQVTPSPTNPARQTHSNPSGVSMQVALEEQLSRPKLHSSISAEREREKVLDEDLCKVSGAAACCVELVNVNASLLQLIALCNT